jgi:hypothetical protein
MGAVTQIWAIVDVASVFVCPCSLEMMVLVKGLSGAQHAVWQHVCDRLLP